jgi:mRNA degradation ribonuclease J1/J2
MALAIEKAGVFISHAHEDAIYAQTLKRYIQTMFSTKTKVFVSTDYQSIPTGQSWFEAIAHALRSTWVTIVLLSPSSIESKWICFEAGIGLGSGAVLLPYSIRGVNASTAASPFAHLHIRTIEDEKGFADFVKRLQEYFELRNEIDPVLAVRELKSIGRL